MILDLLRRPFVALALVLVLGITVAVTVREQRSPIARDDSAVRAVLQEAGPTSHAAPGSTL